MTIKDIIDYVVHTPNNSNPAVLRGLLEELAATADKEEEVEHELKDLVQKTMTDPFIDRTIEWVGKYGLAYI